MASNMFNLKSNAQLELVKHKETIIRHPFNVVLLNLTYTNPFELLIVANVLNVSIQSNASIVGSFS